VVPQQPEMLAMPSDDDPSTWMTLDEVPEHFRLCRTMAHDLTRGGEIRRSDVAGKFRRYRPVVSERMLAQRLGSPDPLGEHSE